MKTLISPDSEIFLPSASSSESGLKDSSSTVGYINKSYTAPSTSGPIIASDIEINLIRGSDFEITAPDLIMHDVVCDYTGDNFVIISEIGNNICAIFRTLQTHITKFDLGKNLAISPPIFNKTNHQYKLCRTQIYDTNYLITTTQYYNTNGIELGILCTDGELFFSTNTGASWSQSNYKAFVPSGYICKDFAITQTYNAGISSNTYFILLEVDSSVTPAPSEINYRVIYSLDNGVTWIPSTISFIEGISFTEFSAHDDWYALRTTDGVNIYEFSTAGATSTIKAIEVSQSLPGSLESVAPSFFVGRRYRYSISDTGVWFSTPGIPHVPALASSIYEYDGYVKFLTTYKVNPTIQPYRAFYKRISKASDINTIVPFSSRTQAITAISESYGTLAVASVNEITLIDVDDRQLYNAYSYSGLYYSGNILYDKERCMTIPTNYPIHKAIAVAKQPTSVGTDVTTGTKYATQSAIKIFYITKEENIYQLRAITYKDDIPTDELVINLKPIINSNIINKLIPFGDFNETKTAIASGYTSLSLISSSAGVLGTLTPYDIVLSDFGKTSDIKTYNALSYDNLLLSEYSSFILNDKLITGYSCDDLLLKITEINPSTRTINPDNSHYNSDTWFAYESRGCASTDATVFAIICYGYLEIFNIDDNDSANEIEWSSSGGILNYPKKDLVCINNAFYALCFNYNSMSYLSYNIDSNTTSSSTVACTYENSAYMGNASIINTLIIVPFIAPVDSSVSTYSVELQIIDTETNTIFAYKLIDDISDAFLAGDSLHSLDASIGVVNDNLYYFVFNNRLYKFDIDTETFSEKIASFILSDNEYISSFLISANEGNFVGTVTTDYIINAITEPAVPELITSSLIAQRKGTYYYSFFPLSTLINTFNISFDYAIIPVGSYNETHKAVCVYQDGDYIKAIEFDYNNRTATETIVPLTSITYYYDYLNVFIRNNKLFISTTSSTTLSTVNNILIPIDVNGKLDFTQIQGQNNTLPETAPGTYREAVGNQDNSLFVNAMYGSNISIIDPVNFYSHNCTNIKPYTYTISDTGVVTLDKVSTRSLYEFSWVRGYYGSITNDQVWYCLNGTDVYCFGDVLYSARELYWYVWDTITDTCTPMTKVPTIAGELYNETFYQPLVSADGTVVLANDNRRKNASNISVFDVNLYVFKNREYVGTFNRKTKYTDTPNHGGYIQLDTSTKMAYMSDTHYYWVEGAYIYSFNLATHDINEVFRFVDLETESDVMSAFILDEFVDGFIGIACTN